MHIAGSLTTMSSSITEMLSPRQCCMNCNLSSANSPAKPASCLLSARWMQHVEKPSIAFQRALTTSLVKPSEWHLNTFKLTIPHPAGACRRLIIAKASKNFARLISTLARLCNAMQVTSISARSNETNIEAASFINPAHAFVLSNKKGLRGMCISYPLMPQEISLAMDID